VKIRFAVPLALALFVALPALAQRGESITMFTPIKDIFRRQRRLAATPTRNRKSNVTKVAAPTAFRT
jgi:hypothetical protein